MTALPTAPPAQPDPYAPGISDGERAVDRAIVMAVLGIVVIPIVLGPLALVQLRRAYRLGIRFGVGLVSVTILSVLHIGAGLIRTTVAAWIVVTVAHAYLTGTPLRLDG